MQIVFKVDGDLRFTFLVPTFLLEPCYYLEMVFLEISRGISGDSKAEMGTFLSNRDPIFLGKHKFPGNILKLF